MAFDSDYIWLEGEFVPFRDAKLHFLTSSLHYGTGIFEGIRSYATPDGPAVFRLKDHLKRLLKSVQILGLGEIPYTFVHAHITSPITGSTLATIQTCDLNINLPITVRHR